MQTEQVHHYKVLIERGQDGFFIAWVPAIPGCHTQGKTYEELIANVKEAIQLCLEVANDTPDYKKKLAEAAYAPTFIGIEEVAVRV
ncbi:hypothetical protein A3B21_03090 [Candidatus Uhrbacteria bacterium RIFCSPLOWO2_01_FULL_47_24]|uniref:HicB-like antitoxin of toxin-antitoxin system domain-containing protein n=1 Tax=Candidatus Uhrbacteria bacterium RIFCSPLOWO2_01_FULL_47_24 TaxID=1802401 RepID=A0A1F7URM7_9BACT|nr:MAG: hypothetical protein A2753_05015 [Candidatus Uhrbacteria bacterium RIFCSPHIGHO2_01_FULL_47_11]OGL67572.1 MAG: hypothetical protein A3D58_03690 [Candidatus Uhrbacteria bacterium RIFCSPHIGHO2_02_FULL_46_47]OGL75169.1 MAG: hypothetical protein A3F52_02705 [Candidatus Uhrbacteria bacterium RIFCSPHIGHO2_12_FULL_47_11]OGL80926.1 MAG: hypothetical protein A3B21_03090 [Candidatus Uhrbacteria bacterium RIFCSPLOWO2_01_FULL_47_24]OGL84261.1 MAG: hypothetical protein A3J03_03090 [Candidatus Uhrbact